jgi:hypothetical protein
MRHGDEVSPSLPPSCPTRSGGIVALVGLLAIAGGCSGGSSELRVEPLFTSEVFDGCLMANPLQVESNGEAQLLVVDMRGTVAGLDPLSGETLWTTSLPVSDDLQGHVMATPAAVAGQGLVVIAWQDVEPENFARVSHHAAVVDLDAQAVDPRFPTVTFEAEVPDAEGEGSVVFRPRFSLQQAQLVHAHTSDTTAGLAYVGFGNAPSVLPWHGWLFELDLDAWVQGGAEAAVAGLLVTTPDSDCEGMVGTDGARSMICGGGIWAPAGPQLRMDEGPDHHLIVPTGNGDLDLSRDHYANTLMRVPRGLEFDPECDETLCADFDRIEPSEACMASCRNLFIPRLMPGDPPLSPDSGVCDGLTFVECYAVLDQDLGANAPASVHLADGRELLVQPGKDGALYLLDAEHLGTLYDRYQAVDFCGTPDDPCRADWAGMFVTQPVVTEVDGDPLVMAASFMFDDTHPAGVVAVKVVLEDGEPRLRPQWEAPSFDTSEAIQRFRRHASRMALGAYGGEEYAWVVDVGPQRARGTLLGVRVRDGEIVVRRSLDGPGERYMEPILEGERLYVTSCETPTVEGQVEAFRVTPRGP